MEDLNSTPEVKKSFINFSPKDNPVAFIAFLFFAFLAFGAISVFMINTAAEKSQNKDIEDQVSQFKPLSDKTVVYGYWTENESQIRAINLKSGEILDIATLPSNIKKITIISPGKIVYIDQTDVRDHGKKIAIYDLKSRNVISEIEVSSGFGIDDYVISPNKKYIAIWEVSVPEGKALSDGKSRVYTVDIDNPSIKNLIFDEMLVKSIYAHYPVGITNTGEIFMDTFQPNVGVGWANGMYSSNFEGTIKASIDVMPSGTYGTQPKLSPDGKYLVFGGFSGEQKIGSSSADTDGYRRAIVSPNTIELLDVATKQRAKINNISAQNVYPNVAWDDSSGKILYSAISKDVLSTGQYLYDLSSRSSKKIDDITREGITDTYTVLASLGEDKLLAGQQNLSPSALGNLGKTYARSLTELGVYNQDNKLTPLTLGSALVQYIDVLPSAFFTNTINSISSPNADYSRESTNQLQLQTFVLKPTLEPLREELQSDPPLELTMRGKKQEGLCRDVGEEQCNELLGTNIELDDYPLDGRNNNPSFPPEFTQCYQEVAVSSGCSDSPLYLYGDKGKSVNVSIGTEVYNSNAPYEGIYEGILTGSGGIKIGGNNYSSLEYDYVPAIRRFPKLNYGKTVKVSEVRNVIREYGQKLGLNNQEIIDTANKLEGKFDAPYVFVSFYDDKTSKAILPISFDPKPDVYRNIVFYLNEVQEPIVIKAPTFEKYPERRGFTAVEVSYIIE